MARTRDDSGLVSCPVHPESWVVRNGLYSSGHDRRQRWRCTPEDGVAHNFAGRVVRTVLDDETTCQSCEQSLARHQGPGVVHGYRFPVGEVAAALVRVGQGMTYSEAARRAKIRTRRGSTPTAQLVGNWVEVFGPIVTAARAETAWPETLVIDAKELHANKPGGVIGAVFTLLGVFGYETGQKKGRLVALKAVPGSVSTRKWAGLLASLPGQPTMVITDRDKAAIGAVTQVFPNTVIRLCRWHLRGGLTDRVRTAVGSSKTHPLRIAAETATDDMFEWSAFQMTAAQYPHAAVGNFISTYDKYLVDEFVGGMGVALPDHWANGAVEQALFQVGETLKPRAFPLRNAERTNRLLELFRFQQNRWDDEGAYSAAIREHVTGGGPLTPQLSIKDPAGQPSLR
jgi:hypothetical protein